MTCRPRPYGRLMSIASVPTLAGIASTVIFAGSTLPMLAKAVRTRDLASYSLGNLLMANVGNAVHSVYVFSLPAGPVWLLHSFNEAVAAFMLAWFVRHELLPTRAARGSGAEEEVRHLVPALSQRLDEVHQVLVVTPPHVHDGHFLRRARPARLDGRAQHRAEGTLHRHLVDGAAVVRVGHAPSSAAASSPSAAVGTRLTSTTSSP